MSGTVNWCRIMRLSILPTVSCRSCSCCHASAVALTAVSRRGGVAAVPSTAPHSLQRTL